MPLVTALLGGKVGVPTLRGTVSMTTEILSEVDHALVEQVFEEAKRDRSKAFELKRELDRWEVIPDFNDRFLDAFREKNE